MAIKSSIGIGVVDILAADTTVLQVPAGERLSIVGFSLHNETAPSAVDVDFFVSDGPTSAAGSKVATYTVESDKSYDITEIMGQGLIGGQYIIAVASAVGCNVLATITQYTEDSV